jgi:chemotaxis protein MotA
LELGSVIGFAVGGLCIVLGIMSSGDWQISALGAFIDVPSLLIVVGGTVGAVLIATPFSKVASSFKAVSIIFALPKVNPLEAIERIISLANIARKEGLLALEDVAKSMDDKFLQKGVMLIVDGTDPELVRNILDTELAYIERRHSETRGVWDNVAALAPAWGMIGTLMGLVIMLGNLSDPDSIGPSMAVALITTFYGSVLANYVAMPIAAKLKNFSADELLIKEVLIEGMLSIQAGENPRIIEEKLKAFLSPNSNNSEENDAGGE